MAGKEESGIRAGPLCFPGSRRREESPRFGEQARCALRLGLRAGAGNQAREPRRRRHAPAPARDCARIRVPPQGGRARERRNETGWRNDMPERENGARADRPPGISRPLPGRGRKWRLKSPLPPGEGWVRGRFRLRKRRAKPGEGPSRREGPLPASPASPGLRSGASGRGEERSRRRRETGTTSCPKRPQHMRPRHAEHDIP